MGKCHFDLIFEVMCVFSKRERQESGLSCINLKDTKNYYKKQIYDAKFESGMGAKKLIKNLFCCCAR